MKTCLATLALLLAASSAGAAPVAYAIDPSHTFPSFEADHLGISVWRGKFNKSSGKDFFDVRKHPRAVFKGRLQSPVDGVPTQLVGELTMRGVTRPLALTIRSLKCIQHPMLKRDYCGADAYGSFNRDEFDLDAGKDYGFSMNVDLRIQVEAIAQP